ncbi:hypothetical protein GH714_042357 [Hevea brasiliensis]|uniref:tRNA/rRNA methyltransferase SpoU type domain-containing protein n=1 Tax=Hevea brasiliensis TaxID=3981 RepID=A0A6A6KAA0_HEVBR|nr:hypothetical protein GH714_042357 [Hevea brasiliensis]
MQSTYASCVAAVFPQPLNHSNSKPRLSTASPCQPQTQTQKISQFRYFNTDGDIDNSAEVKFTLPANEKFTTSTSTPFVKHCVKLRHSSSCRHFHGSALVVGTTPIRDTYKFLRSSEERTVEMECLILLDKAKVPKGLDNSSTCTVPAGDLRNYLNIRVFFTAGSRRFETVAGGNRVVPIVTGNWHHLEALKDEFEMKLFAGHPASNGKLKPLSPLSQALADSLADVPLCLVLGNEGHGLSEQSLQECELVSIPKARNYESLNVAFAGGIFLCMLQPKSH